MKRVTPTVEGQILLWKQGASIVRIQVGSPDWQLWLEANTSFTYSGEGGSFTARKESRQRGAQYWRAYRKRGGQLYRAYLGKSGALTVERLNEVAVELAGTDGPILAQGRKSIRESQPVAGTFGTEKASVHLDAQLPDRSLRLLSPDDLLRTKMLRPPARSNLIPRPHLKAILEEGLQHRLTLISAPAGFGKTTLLSRWVPVSECPVAWVSLNTSDNDPGRFWSYVLGALHHLRPGLGLATLASSPHAAKTQPAESVLTTLINLLSQEPQDIALVLDDYNNIENRTIHLQIEFLVENLPPSFHLIISTRTDPPLPLARMRGKGQLIELRAADLGFTVEETATFLNDVMKLKLSRKDVLALEKRTEGWIVGLQLAALSLKGQNDPSRFVEAFAGDHHHVLEYLVEEVLRQQPENVQNFLLLTSVLDRLCGPLCEAVSGQTDGQSMLESLEKANLFTVPLDHEHHWFRYHHLFADALRVRLNWSSHQDVPELHRRACQWFAENGLASEGVNHALAAGEFELAADLIAQARDTMIKRSEHVTVVDWIKALPDRLVRGRPHLCVLYAYALAGTGELDTAETWLQHAERQVELNEISPRDGRASPSGKLEDDAERVIAGVVAVRATIAGYRGDTPLAVTLSRRALEIAPNDEAAVRSVVAKNLGTAYWLSGDTVGAQEALSRAGSLSQEAGFISNAAVALSELAGIQVVGGQLREAEKTCRQALRLVEDHGSLPIPETGAPYVSMGWLYYEWNDLEAAERFLARGIELSRLKKIVVITLPAYGALARVKQAQGYIEEALDILRDAESLARTNDLTHSLSRLSIYKVRLWLAKGDLEAAIRWADNIQKTSDRTLNYQDEAEYMTLARVRIAQGQPNEAMEILSRLIEMAEDAYRMGSVVKLLVLKSLAQDGLGEFARGAASLERALILAEPEGYVRTFVDAGPSVAAMLAKRLDWRRLNRSRTTTAASDGYIEALLRAFDSGPVLSPRGAHDRISAKKESTHLSDREIEVLRLIAAGWSAPDIAREFVVAASTVRTHFKNIYEKFDAHNRTQAIARARELGLLP